MGEAQRAKGQPQQKQVNIAGPSRLGAIHTTYAHCPCSLSSVPVWTRNDTATLLTGHIKGSVPRRAGIPGRPDHHPPCMPRNKACQPGRAPWLLSWMMCEELCVAAPGQQACSFPPRQTLLPPCWLPPLQYLEVRAFPLGLRPSMVLGSRSDEPVSGRPHPRPLPKDRLQDSSVASRSFHSWFFIFASLFSSLCDSLPLLGFSLSCPPSLLLSSLQGDLAFVENHVL